MFAGIRPYVVASAAMAGAGVIAVTPIAPPPASIPVASPAVQLTSVPSPLQLYPQVLVQSLTNAGALLGQYFADPFPIISATLENQASAFADAVAALKSADYEQFFAAASDIVLQPFKSADAALSTLGAILAQPFAIEGFTLVAISPVLAGIAATGKAIVEVIEAITQLDLIGAVNAVINIPARIVDGFLNGVADVPFGILQNLPGLLTPSEPEVFTPPGPISIGIGLDQDMGAAIPPRTSATPIAETPDPDAAAVTLTVDASETGDPQPDLAASDAIEKSDATDDSEMAADEATEEAGADAADDSTKQDIDDGTAADPDTADQPQDHTDNDTEDATTREKAADADAGSNENDSTSTKPAA